MKTRNISALFGAKLYLEKIGAEKQRGDKDSSFLGTPILHVSIWQTLQVFSQRQSMVLGDMCFLPQYILSISCAMTHPSAVARMCLVWSLAHNCCFRSRLAGLQVENKGSDCMSKGAVQGRNPQFHSQAAKDVQGAVRSFPVYSEKQNQNLWSVLPELPSSSKLVCVAVEGYLQESEGPTGQWLDFPSFTLSSLCSPYLHR